MVATTPRDTNPTLTAASAHTVTERMCLVTRQDDPRAACMNCGVGDRVGRDVIGACVVEAVGVGAMRQMEGRVIKFSRIVFATLATPSMFICSFLRRKSKKQPRGRLNRDSPVLFAASVPLWVNPSTAPAVTHSSKSITVVSSSLHPPYINTKLVLGELVGEVEGLSVGDTVGRLVGRTVGESNGDCVGETEGNSVGPGVVGIFVGCRVGD